MPIERQVAAVGRQHNFYPVTDFAPQQKEQSRDGLSLKHAEIVDQT